MGKIAQFGRFLVAGVANTAATWLLYLVFNLALPYLFAYTLAYALAVVLSYLINSIWVFRTPLSTRSFAGFPLVYAVQYLVSSGLLYVFVDHLRLRESIAPLLAVALTVPVTFMMARFVLTRFQRREGDCS